MKRYPDRIEKTKDDVPCRDCANTFRGCPMQLVMAMSRVPEGMEIAVLNCPEYRKLEDLEAEKARSGKTIGGLIKQ